MTNHLKSGSIVRNMGVKRTIVDTAIFILSIAGLALIFFTDGDVLRIFGSVLLFLGIVLSFNRSLGYAILKWVGL